MTSFIGRDYEVNELERISSLPKASIVVVRGRRRIGKSRLISEFASKYRFFEVQGLAPRKAMSANEQLEHFSQEYSRHFDMPGIRFNSWNEAFHMLAKVTRRGKHVILLDEISWMSHGSVNFIGELKSAWDTKLKLNNQLMLVLCGSVSAWINENIINSTDFVGRLSSVLTLQELPLPACSAFWRKQADLTSAFEKLKILSITGGVPRYLEEINFKANAETTIRDLCYKPSGLLFREFDSIFNDIFNKRASLYKDIVTALVDGKKNLTQLAKAIKGQPNGVLTKYLEELELSGFIRRDYVYDLKRRIKKPKTNQYRLSDNYVRFYLKYIEPQKDRIEQGLLKFSNLETLPGINTMLGFQFENLILSNIQKIAEIIELPEDSILSASPYYQNQTQRQKACQIDLLIQTPGAIYICEIKFRKKITKTVIHEVQEKIKRLKYDKTLSIRPVLIYAGELSSEIRKQDFFNDIISIETLLENK